MPIILKDKDENILGEVWQSQGENSKISINVTSYNFIINGYIYDYLKHNGNSYIETDIFPSDNTKIYCKYKMPSAGDDNIQAPFGSRIDYKKSMFGNVISFGRAPQYLYQYINKSLDMERVRPNVNDIVEVEMNKEEILLNGTKIYGEIAEGLDSDINLAIGAYKENKTIKWGFKDNIYSFKVYENDILIKNLVPSKDSKEIACWYDMINKEFVYNSGTSEYEVGEKIGYIKDNIVYNMDGTLYNKDEFLQSLTLNGSYFGTGYYPIPSLTGTKAKFSYTATEAVGLYGSRNFNAISRNSCNIFNIGSRIRVDVLGSNATSTFNSNNNEIVNYEHNPLAKRVAINDNISTSNTEMNSIRIPQEYLIGTFMNNNQMPYTPPTTFTIYNNDGKGWEIIEDGIVVKRYLPVKRGTDGVICLKNILDGTYLEPVGGKAITEDN